MDFNVQYPTIPAGIEPQPVVQVITINTIIATIVRNIFHPFPSELDEDVELDLVDEVADDVVPAELFNELLPRLTISPNSFITYSDSGFFFN